VLDIPGLCETRGPLGKEEGVCDDLPDENGRRNNGMGGLPAWAVSIVGVIILVCFILLGKRR